MAAKPQDAGLQLIERYERAIIAARMEHLSTGGYTPDELAQERAAIEVLAARIGAAHRAHYRARSLGHE